MGITSYIKKNPTVLNILMAVSPIVVFSAFNFRNILLPFSLVLGLVVFPYVVKVAEKQGSFRYAIAAILTGVILLFFRSNSLFYFSSVFILFFVIERLWGWLNYLSFFLAVVVSPLISNMVYIWSFPIRLQLSRLSGIVLRWIQMDIQVDGNIVILEGHTFSVDPACIGLKMVVTSLVLSIVILAYFEKKYKTTISFGGLILFLSAVLLGAIIANFIRLLTLIIFHILPENPLHDVIGILSLCAYVLLPFYFFVKTIFKRIPVEERSISNSLLNANPRKASLWDISLFILLMVLHIFNGKQFLKTPIENIEAVQNIQIDGLKKEITPNGVLKLQNEEVLIYIKPPVQFFQGSHDPRFCWNGSGYTFSEVQIENVEGKSVYTALLSKGNDQMYSAWWYDNSTLQTPHEWDWRIETLKGNAPFFMINISCTDRATLNKWVKKKILL